MAKESTIHIRVSSEEKELIKERAGKYNLSMSDYLRMIACSEIMNKER